MNIIKGWLDAAIEIGYDNKSMSREGHKVTHLVLHSTAGGTSAENIAHYFHDSPVQASAHIIIGTDGHVVQGMSLDLAAWSNGLILNPTIPWNTAINPNYYCVSIEHCKASTDNSDELTEAQKLVSFQVIAAICDYYGIPKRRGDVRGGIVSHADFDSVNRARCPGPFPWSELFAFLNGGSMSSIPAGWHDSNNTLTAPNNIPVVRGFRDFVLAHNWDPANVPLEQEHAEKPLELSNPTLGDGTKQTFRWTVLEWTPSKGVFVAETGKEAMLLRILAENAKSASGVDVTAIMGHVQAILALLSAKP